MTKRHFDDSSRSKLRGGDKRVSAEPHLQHLRDDENIIFNQDKALVVKFACFITCLSNSGCTSPPTTAMPPSSLCSDSTITPTTTCTTTTTPCSGSSSVGNRILSIRIPGFGEPSCISVAVNRGQAIEVYMECDGLPLTRLLRAMEEDMGLCCVAIFTFGSKPKSNGAPEALARIRFRAERCGFTRYDRGTPSVAESPDFDIRDKLLNWVRFTADQMGLMLASDGSRPCEVVEWCIVQCFGDTSMLENRLRELRIRTGSCREYYIKGFECMRTPNAARIYLEIEPIVKTVLLRCLVAALASGGRFNIEIMTFPANQQAKALAYVSDLGGTLVEHGNLSEIAVSRRPPAPSCVITRFTQHDLAVWDCVVIEPPPVHWSVGERDAELTRLKADAAVLRAENSFLRNESTHYSQQCGRFLAAVEELKADRDQLRRELDFRKSSSLSSDAVHETHHHKYYDDGSLVGWSEWEMMRCALEDRDRCIAQLRAQLGEIHDQMQRLQRGEMVVADEWVGVCNDGSLTPGHGGGLFQ